ncbi:molybdopterin-dependent oxidoreductase [Natronobacterium texcoconense]|uniref:Oxidoreductase molybdopterin binding domain-containing protein n=1 Tax=Natronobacterium texcoconense TaxID=1095778 RepID=A0A1H1HJT8_NATTX|nr:molybdopterin-dependent oxidoreductase [Natronobacterium texcoconense]SDR25643.1 Oxidoreductase molybdopterin binding domain-containing protein [Natronobacterium texcoconense]
MNDLKPHGVPEDVDPAEWTLRISGTVDRSVRFTLDDLASYSSETAADDFACAERWVAEGLSWYGVHVGTLLEHSEPTAESEYGLVRAMDGEYACSFPLARLSDSILALELDGEPLPVEHGGPARLVPLDDDRDCWESIKWVSEIVIDESPFTDADTAKQLALSRIEM